MVSPLLAKKIVDLYHRALFVPYSRSEDPESCESAREQYVAELFSHVTDLRSYVADDVVRRIPWATDRYGMNLFDEVHFSGKDGFSNMPATIRIIHRDDDTQAMRERRKESLRRFYQVLTPDMRSTIKAVSFRRFNDLRGEAHKLSGYLILGVEDLCAACTSYHEVAHLLTYRLFDTKTPFVERWDEARGDAVYQSDNWTSLGVIEANKMGFITSYASIDISEDVSELTAYIYVHPDIVRAAVAYNPKAFTDKIEALLAFNFITYEQYRYVLGHGENSYVPTQNCGLGLHDETIAYNRFLLDPSGTEKSPAFNSILVEGDRFDKATLRFITYMSRRHGKNIRVEWQRASGNKCKKYFMDCSTRIADLMRRIYTNPYELRTEVADSPAMRRQIDFLFEFYFIDSDQYEMLTSNPLDGSSVAPF